MKTPEKNSVIDFFFYEKNSISIFFLRKKKEARKNRIDRFSIFIGVFFFKADASNASNAPLYHPNAGTCSLASRPLRITSSTGVALERDERNGLVSEPRLSRQ